MKEEFPNLLESSETTKAESGKEINEQLKERLLDLLDPILHNFFDTKGIGEDIEILDAANKDTKQLSIETGEFFRSLIPEGLRKPEKDDVPTAGSYNWIMLLEHIEEAKILTDEVSKLSRKEYKDQKKEILKDSLHGRKRIAIKGEVNEIDRSENVVEQTVTNAWAQDGNKNLIYERVSNTLNRSKNTSTSESSLLIQDIETGTTLDLNALLPADYKYVPKAMDKEIFQADAESANGFSYKQKEFADLNNYEMGKSDPKGFVERSFFNIVNYGDLLEKGGILSLLHEVAHAWQNKYYRTSHQGRLVFERTYKKVVSQIARLDIPKDNENYVEPDKIWEILEKEGVECLNKNGTEHPINQEGVINIPNTYYNDHVYLDIKFIEEFYLSDTNISQSEREQLQSYADEKKSKIRFYQISSDALKKNMDIYISEERDAWAHAIRTIRFLRHKGLDVEPMLKKINDFKGVMDPCLASYQDDLEMTILNQKTGYRFSRAPKSE